MELDGETSNVDLREKEMDGEGERWCSSIGGLLTVTGETSGGNKTGEGEGFRI